MREGERGGERERQGEGEGEQTFENFWGPCAVVCMLFTAGRISKKSALQ